MTTSASRNAGDAMSLFLDLKNGELHRADFVETSCYDSVIEQVKLRRGRDDAGLNVIKQIPENRVNTIRKAIEFSSQPVKFQ
jgi:hypothetical protein